MLVLVPGRLADRLLLVAALLWVPLVLLVGLFLIYLWTPHDLGWHLYTSLHRTMYGVTPAVFALADFASTFATGPGSDAGRPFVTTQRPGNGASNVPVDQSLVLYVNELLDTATVPSAPPSASDPVSPMNIRAGWVLNQRQPSAAPTTDMQ